jgi:SAM-dependent methyltransferase
MLSLDEWFQTPLGCYLAEREQSHFDREVGDIFGFNAVQVGLAQFDFLRTNRMQLRICAGSKPPAQLHATPTFLPIASQSVDLLVMPHVLEFSSQPHQILREAERVLMPEGNLIITGFNPRSLWGFRSSFDRDGDYPWCGDFIALSRLKDWLALLGFEIVSGKMCCYVPPANSEKWLPRFRFMELAGARWWAMGGGVYFLRAVKRVPGMRVIMPKWHERLAAKISLAPAPQKILERQNGTND